MATWVKLTRIERNSDAKMEVVSLINLDLAISIEQQPQDTAILFGTDPTQKVFVKETPAQILELANAPPKPLGGFGITSTN